MKKNLFLMAGAFAAMTMLYSCSQDAFDEFDFQNNNIETEIGTRAVTNGTIDFEDVNLGSGTSVYNLQYSKNGATFSNVYTLYPEYNYEYWDGFAYSCKGNNVLTDIATGQFDVYNAGGAITTGAGHSSDKFAVAYVGSYNNSYPTITFDEPVYVSSFYVNNTAYAVTSMMNGDSYAKKFVQGDWFKLTIKGYDTTSATTPVYTKEIYLADYRDTDSTNWSMIRTWTLYDGFSDEDAAVRKLVFDLSSSDTGTYGMNTPAYFAIDDLTFDKADE